MPKAARPLVVWFCEPRLSLFDPPTYVLATLREARGNLRVAGTSAMNRRHAPLRARYKTAPAARSTQGSRLRRTHHSTRRSRFL